MGLLERVSTLIRANLNDLLERAEDPEKMIEQGMVDMKVRETLPQLRVQR